MKKKKIVEVEDMLGAKTRWLYWSKDNLGPIAHIDKRDGGVGTIWPYLVGNIELETKNKNLGFKK